MPIELLDTNLQDRGSFDCGVSTVNEYFQRVARQASQRFSSQTFVLVASPPRKEPCDVIGYFTLVLHTYRDGEMDETTAKALKVRTLGTIPTILLGQLGVSTHHQGKAVGSALLADALRRSLVVALNVGAVAVVTDPVDESAAPFYVKHGFKQILTSEPRLIISTTTLARYNPEIVNAFKAQPQAIQISFGSQRYFA